jgi:hypothetical protein
MPKCWLIVLRMRVESPFRFIFIKRIKLSFFRLFKVDSVMYLFLDKHKRFVPISIVYRQPIFAKNTCESKVCLAIKHLSGAYDRIFISQTFAGLLKWGALSDERTGLPFTTAAGPRQRSNSRVRVPRDSRQYITASDSILPFSSPPTTG